LPRPDPDREIFDRDVDWPPPAPEPKEQPVHAATMPLDDDEDRKWR
jgi:hypothetical protein